MRYLERDLWDVGTSKIHIGAVKTKEVLIFFCGKIQQLMVGFYFSLSQAWMLFKFKHPSVCKGRRYDGAVSRPTRLSSREL